MANTIDCRRWRPIWFAARCRDRRDRRHPCGAGGQGGDRDDSDRFRNGGDPVALGLVASLNRPGGNVTGVTMLSVELEPKRLELLHELVPHAAIIALLVNPANPQCRDRNRETLQAAARTLGLQLHVLHASTERDFDMAFATLAQLRADALVIGTDAILQQPERTARRSGGPPRGAHDLPIARVRRGRRPDELRRQLRDAYRLAGVYTGRILKGEKPADLPVQQSTKVELVINLKTAKALGLTVPLSLLGRADEVIE